MNILTVCIHHIIFAEMEVETKPRRRFTPEEDKILLHAVRELNIKNWDEAARLLPGRDARQCRDRYNTSLYKDIDHRKWTKEEDRIIIEQFEAIGPKWMQISTYLEGRSGNNVKNRWYKYIAVHLYEKNMKKKSEKKRKAEKESYLKSGHTKKKRTTHINNDLIVNENEIINDWDIFMSSHIDHEIFNFMAIGCSKI